MEVNACISVLVNGNGVKAPVRKKKRKGMEVEGKYLTASLKATKACSGK